MINIIEFDNEKYNFEAIFSNFFNEKLCTLHKKYKFEPKFLNMTGGKDEYEITKKVYKKIILSKTFHALWINFIKDFIKPYFKNEKILYQKTPSFRIFPSNHSVQYVEKITDGFNKHIDSDSPYYHPKFESNFWIPLTECDHNNDLYYQDKDWFKRVDIDRNKIFVFDSQVYHGNKVKNNSFNTRCSLDFKALKKSDYDLNELTDKIILKRGKRFKQNEWYSTKYYYEEM